MSYKGLFKPRNPNKYKGDPTNIIYRSSYELRLMSYLDLHPDVLEWSSEEIAIPYRSPIDNRIHRYFPDFFVRRKTIDNFVESVIIEVKPYIQVKEPKPILKGAKPTRRYLREVQTWGINSAKWNAAEQYCKQREWKFQIITEKDLGISNGKRIRQNTK